MTTAEAVIHGSGQFWIQDGETFPPVETWDQSNGLLVLASVGAAVLTGPANGPITVSVDVRTSRPADADDGYALGGDVPWDDIVEAGVTCREGPLQVCAEPTGFADLPRLDSSGPGSYRLRLHAINRDRPAHDADGFPVPTDRYLIVAWPEPPATPLLIRLSDLAGYNTRGSLWMEENGRLP
jgi:hypothetical protein